MATTRLDPERVVETALRLLNEVGLEGLTLRRIATELDVRAPALYWHFHNKQALLDAMATAMYREVAERTSPAPQASWQQHCLAVHRALRLTLLSYRDGAKVFSGTRFTDTGHAATMERQLRAMTEAGFSPGAAARAAFVLYAFTEGFVSEEQGVYPVPGERREGFDVDERAAALGAEHPLSALVGSDLFEDYESRFEEGLALILAGIETTHGIS